MNALVFGQHDPGKTPKGKTVKREMYVWRSSSKSYNKKINTKEPVIVASSSQA
jgi:hypothetical protein